jgi:dephospho-CoA kinase
MKIKIIALVGETGAGKDTFAAIVKENFSSVLLLRFSESLTAVLKIFFDEVKKEDQQWLVNLLRDRFGEDILMKAVAKKIERAKEEIVIINGIRVIEEFNFIKNLGGTIVYVTLDAKERWERVRIRKEKKDDDVSYEKFLEIDNRRPEKQIGEIGKKADIKIENTGNLEELKMKAIEIINNL